MELAIINGTYRDNSNGKMAAANGMSRLTMPGLLQERIKKAIFLNGKILRFLVAA